MRLKGTDEFFLEEAITALYWKRPLVSLALQDLRDRLVAEALELEPTITLPGPEGEPNVELVLADENEGDWR